MVQVKNKTQNWAIHWHWHFWYQSVWLGTSSFSWKWCGWLCMKKIAWSFCIIRWDKKLKETGVLSLWKALISKFQNLPGLRPGPRWGAHSAPQTPAGLGELPAKPPCVHPWYGKGGEKSCVKTELSLQVRATFFFRFLESSSTCRLVCGCGGSFFSFLLDWSSFPTPPHRKMWLL